ncbi:MAG: hypothetical protein RBG13Loki_2507 [Promethearchaeota archaeon CR_4]|nr:MAG: hypothetical protein RBG13Loki_2507 [Candidatus Lokiarchaeota archaeon CR_4]
MSVHEFTDCLIFLGFFLVFGNGGLLLLEDSFVLRKCLPNLTFLFLLESIHVTLAEKFVNCSIKGRKRFRGQTLVILHWKRDESIVIARLGAYDGGGKFGLHQLFRDTFQSEEDLVKLGGGQVFRRCFFGDSHLSTDFFSKISSQVEVSGDSPHEVGIRMQHSIFIFGLS